MAEPNTDGGPDSGLALLKDELSRQHRDALASFHANRDKAADIARLIVSRKRLVLLGMGASHWINRVAAVLYRQAGVDASAEVLSDYMRAPLAAGERVTIVTSQSGESGEVKAYFRKFGDQGNHFGVTLAGESTLARALPCLIGGGGPEKAYAATRSVMMTLAMHAAVLNCLGHDTGAFLEVLSGPSGTEPPIDPHLLEPLLTCDALFLSSRGVEHGVLEVAALTFMELARVPALALELGQLIHGPFEAFGPKTALILARPSGAESASLTRFAEMAVGIGVRPILFDIGALAPVKGALSVTLPERTGLAGAAQLLPAVQRLLIEAAARRVSDMGTPLRSKKVTDGEGF